MDSQSFDANSRSFRASSTRPSSQEAWHDQIGLFELGLNSNRRVKIVEGPERRSPIHRICLYCLLLGR